MEIKLNDSINYSKWCEGWGKRTKFIIGFVIYCTEIFKVYDVCFEDY